MARMLGENLLPEVIQTRRRMVRERLMDVRDPIRRRRRNMVPGPDIIGTAERNIADMRNKVVEKEGILGRVRGDNSSSSSSSSSSSTSSSSGSSSSSTNNEML